MCCCAAPVRSLRLPVCGGVPVVVDGCRLAILGPREALPLGGLLGCRGDVVCAACSAPRRSTAVVATKALLRDQGEPDFLGIETSAIWCPVRGRVPESSAIQIFGMLLCYCATFRTIIPHHVLSRACLVKQAAQTFHHFTTVLVTVVRRLWHPGVRCTVGIGGWWRNCTLRVRCGCSI